MARKKVRQWSNLKGQLRPDPEQVELSERMKRVLKEKDERAAKSMNDLALEFASLEEEEAFEALAAHERNIKFEAIERRILEELQKIQDMAGTDMWRGDGHTFSPKYHPRPIVTDPGKLLTWIHDTGQDSLLRLLPPTLQSIVGEALNTDLAATLTPAQRAAMQPGSAGSGTPPPGVDVVLRTTVNHRGPGKKRRQGDDEASAAGGPADGVFETTFEE